MLNINVELKSPPQISFLKENQKNKFYSVNRAGTNLALRDISVSDVHQETEKKISDVNCELLIFLPLIGRKYVPVCVGQSQPRKHRKLQTSHRFMYCTKDKNTFQKQNESCIEKNRTFSED